MLWFYFYLKRFFCCDALKHFFCSVSMLEFSNRILHSIHVVKIFIFHLPSLTDVLHRFIPTYLIYPFCHWSLERTSDIFFLSEETISMIKTHNISFCPRFVTETSTGGIMPEQTLPSNFTPGVRYRQMKLSAGLIWGGGYSWPPNAEARDLLPAPGIGTCPDIIRQSLTHYSHNVRVTYQTGALCDSTDCPRMTLAHEI